MKTSSDEICRGRLFVDEWTDNNGELRRTFLVVKSGWIPGRLFDVCRLKRRHECRHFHALSVTLADDGRLWSSDTTITACSREFACIRKPTEDELIELVVERLVEFNVISKTGKKIAESFIEQNQKRAPNKTLN